jgi:hypothetical protein
MHPGFGKSFSSVFWNDHAVEFLPGHTYAGLKMGQFVRAGQAVDLRGMQAVASGQVKFPPIQGRGRWKLPR